jgi:hypothetical protein
MMAVVVMVMMMMTMMIRQEFVSGGLHKGYFPCKLLARRRKILDKTQSQ